MCVWKYKTILYYTKSPLPPLSIGGFSRKQKSETMKEAIKIEERVLEWHSPQYPALVEQRPPQYALQYEDAEIVTDTQPPTKALTVADTTQSAPTLVVADNRHRQPDIVADRIWTVGQYIIGATVIVGAIGGFVWVLGLVLEIVAEVLVVAIEVVKDIAFVVACGIGIIAAIQVARLFFASSAPPQYDDHIGTQQSNNTGQTINININGSGSQVFNQNPKQ